MAEQEREGGISPRVSPLAQVRDAGNLLGRAGLTLPAVDIDTLTVHYDSGAYVWGARVESVTGARAFTHTS